VIAEASPQNVEAVRDRVEVVGKLPVGATFDGVGAVARARREPAHRMPVETEPGGEGPDEALEVGTGLLGGPRRVHGVLRG